MKLLKFSIIIFFISNSCTSNKSEAGTLVSSVEIKIPEIEKNRNDASFKLLNGILFFDAAVYSGIVNEFYKTGELKSISEYYQGKRQGNFLGWYKNGNKWFERFYINGLKAGEHKGWFPNCQKMFHYQFNNKGQYNGFVKDWHANGVFGKYFNFENGKEKGAQKMWNLKGKIKANFFTIDGERHGLIGLKKCISVLTNKDSND